MGTSVKYKLKYFVKGLRKLLHHGFGLVSYTVVKPT